MNIFFFKDFQYAPEFVLQNALPPAVGDKVYFFLAGQDPVTFFVKETRYEVYKMGITSDAMTSGRIAVLIEEV